MKRFAHAWPVALLLGCSTPVAPPAAPPPPAPFVQQVPPPEFQRDLPLESPSGHFCQLGRSCLALDPRPFEVCLVSGARDCRDKIVEPLLAAEESAAAAPPARQETASK
jgi:hypothetical protein